jgi:hypothetical protein
MLVSLSILHDDAKARGMIGLAAIYRESIIRLALERIARQCQS